MLNNNEKLVCDREECKEEIDDDNGYFVDTPDGGFDFCSWGCVAAYASEMSE